MEKYYLFWNEGQIDANVSGLFKIVEKIGSVAKVGLTFTPDKDI
jgi:hypothetical protein